MPTYDYECQACGYRFEKFQSMTAKVLRKCPECGQLELQRLIGAGAGILFKGSGFYETDYRSRSYQADAKAGAGGESGDKSGGSSSEGGSESGKGKSSPESNPGSKSSKKGEGKSGS